MKSNKRYLLVALALLLATLLISGLALADDAKLPTKLTLSLNEKTSLKLEGSPSKYYFFTRGKTESPNALLVTPVPENPDLDGVKFKWTSSNEDVAYVTTTYSTGYLSTGLQVKKPGKTTVTVTMLDKNNQLTNVTSSLDLEFTTVDAKSIIFDRDEFVLYRNNSLNLTDYDYVTVEPKEATYGKYDLVWSSSDATIASISKNGYLYAKKAGTATITATSKDGKVSKSIPVTVKETEITSITISPKEISWPVNEILNLGDTNAYLTIEPAYGFSPSYLKWTSSDGTIATVNSWGQVKARKTGTVEITATSPTDNTIKGTCTVTFKDVELTGLEFSQSEHSMMVDDDALDLKDFLTVTPKDYIFKKADFKWTSSDVSIATVSDSGIVTAWKPGKATITLTPVEKPDLAKSVTVTVKEAELKKLEFTQKEFTIGLVDDLDLKDYLIVTPKDYTGSFTWTSSDISIATVDGDGDVEPLKPGKVTITVTPEEKPDLAQKVTVTVTAKNVTSVAFKQPSYVFNQDDRLDYFDLLNMIQVTPFDSDYYFPTFSTSNRDVFELYDAELMGSRKDYGTGYYAWAAKPGTATLTVTVKNYDDTTVTATCTVEVKAVEITGFAFESDAYEMTASSSKTDTLDLKRRLIVKPDDRDWLSVFSDDEPKLIWSTSDQTVATVDNYGTVYAVAPGKATITVTYGPKPEISKSVTVTVKGVPVTSVKLNGGNTLTLSRATTTEQKIEFTYEPKNAYVKDITWTSSNPMVATIETGSYGYWVVDEDGTPRYISFSNPGHGYCMIDIQKAGTVTITVKVDDGTTVHEASCEVTIAQEQAETLKINKKKVTLYLHKSASDNKNVEQLYAYDKNKRYGDEDVTWSSSKKSVVSVDRQGNLTVHGKGKATITATMKDGSGMTAKCTVEVKKQNLKSISGNKKITLRVGQKATLSDLYYNEMITFSPSLDKVYDDELIFKSSNRNIVSVNKKTGTLVANSVGTAEITVTSKANKKVTFTFKVKVIDAVQ